MSARTSWHGRRFRSGVVAALGVTLLCALGSHEAHAGGLGPVVSVEPIFGEVSPSAGWNDLVVTIENLEDAPFAGEVESGDGGGEPASGRVSYKVNVAAHTTTMARLPVAVPRFGSEPIIVRVRDAHGKVVAKRTVAVGTGSIPPTLVDLGPPSKSLRGLRGAEVPVSSEPGTSRTLLRIGTVPRDPTTHAPLLPVRSAVYDGVDVVRAAAPELFAIGEPEMLALSTFVLEGGTLLVSGATVEDLDRPRLALLVDPRLRASLRAGAISRTTYGLGEIVFARDAAAVAGAGRDLAGLHASPRGDLNRTPEIGEVLTESSLPEEVGRAHDRRSLRVFPHRGAGGYDEATEGDAIERALDPNESFRGALGAAAVLLVLYAILAGPVLHLRARKRGAPFLPLLGAPLLAASAFGAVVGIGLTSRGVHARARHLALVEAGAGATRGTGVLYRGFFTNRREQLTVRPLAPTSSLARLEGGRTSADHLVVDETTTTLRDLVVLPWQTSVVKESGYFRDLGGSVDVERRDGRLFVHNGLERALVDVLVAEGGTATYFTVIPAGATIDASDGTVVPDHRTIGRDAHTLAAYRLRGDLPLATGDRLSDRWQLAEGLTRGADFWPDSNPVVLAEVEGGRTDRDDSGVAIESDRLLLRVVGTGTRRSP
jgi:hypothetical protein